MQRSPNWDDVRFFLAVARHGGLTGAGRALGVNQSTVSRRIDALEERLEARLFQRRARGYVLTAAGEAVLSLAARVEDDMFAVERVVSGADRALSGVVRLTTVDEVLEAVAPALAAFRKTFPGIELEVDTDLRVASLTRREADVALRPGLPPTEPDVVGRKLVAVSHAFYASPDYLLTRGRPSGLKALRDHDHVSFVGERRQRLLRSLVPEPRFALCAHGLPAQAIAARAGMGIVYLPRFVGDTTRGLERVLTPPSQHELHLWLLVHADLRQSARVRAFVEALTDAVKHLRQRFEGAPAAAHQASP